MSIRQQRTLPPSLRAQLGFTLVELMVTVAIAMFLLAGVVSIVQNIRTSYFNQQALAQFQDQQRFAITILTDIIQSGGYFPDPTPWTPSNSLPAIGSYGHGHAVLRHPRRRRHSRHRWRAFPDRAERQDHQLQRNQQHRFRPDPAVHEYVHR